MKSFCYSIQLKHQQLAIPFPLLMRPVLMSDQQFYAVHPYKDSCPNRTTKKRTLSYGSFRYKAPQWRNIWWECVCPVVARSFNSRTNRHGDWPHDNADPQEDTRQTNGRPSALVMVMMGLFLCLPYVLSIHSGSARQHTDGQSCVLLSLDGRRRTAGVQDCRFTVVALFHCLMRSMGL